uniref:Uncharacterized protein n=1 Tax=Magnetococcus massalia (strain MO-1) TaxID=451514 RepID=A0A1S7LHE1_MAGMO|nr:protein of unknown function [Candidatus Magnetococcus massalia]
MVIAITGFNAKLMLPPATFMAQAGLSQDDQIFLFDNSRRMLLGGVGGELDSFAKLITWLKSAIAERKPHTVFTLGSSGGGHGALLLGHLLKADRAIAFSPYTYGSREKLAQTEDPDQVPFARAIRKIHQLPAALHQYLDLEPLLRVWNGKTSYEVHICHRRHWDRKRAEEIINCPKVELIKHPCSGHLVVPVINDLGLLHHCFGEQPKEAFKQLYAAMHRVTKHDALVGCLK